MKNVKFHEKNMNFAEKFCGKKQIPRLGSKFRGPRKTVSPSDNTGNVQLIIT